MTPSRKDPSQKMADGVAQGVGPEFKQLLQRESMQGVSRAAEAGSTVDPWECLTPR
jgi:hypothetical protein